MRGAARAIAELPVLETPKIAAVEGSEATIEAFRRLTTTFYGALSFKLPPSADELRELQKKAIRSVENGGSTPPPPTGRRRPFATRLRPARRRHLRRYLPAAGLHRTGGGNRLHGLMPKMREAERGPVIEILSRFNDIHRDPEIRESFELFRHVVFDVHGSYYVAVPLDAPPDLSLAEREELRTEAQLLANLFTSFEKDRIFKRTWTPFNGAVRKARQAGFEVRRLGSLPDLQVPRRRVVGVHSGRRYGRRPARRGRCKPPPHRTRHPAPLGADDPDGDQNLFRKKRTRTQLRTTQGSHAPELRAAIQPSASSPSHPRETRVETEWTATDERDAGETGRETWQTPRFRYALQAGAQTAGGFRPLCAQRQRPNSARPRRGGRHRPHRPTSSPEHRPASSRGRTAEPAPTTGAPVPRSSTESISRTSKASPSPPSSNRQHPAPIASMSS